jgi:hypothetical protein
MNADLVVGVIGILFGALAVVFHRRYARWVVAQHQKSPERKEKTLEWVGLVSGALFVVLGIALWGVHHLVGIACLGFGLAWIFFSDRHARRTVTWYRSEEWQRLVTLVAGLMMATLGVLALMGAVATRWQITP